MIINNCTNNRCTIISNLIQYINNNKNNNTINSNNKKYDTINSYNNRDHSVVKKILIVLNAM